MRSRSTCSPSALCRMMRDGGRIIAMSSLGAQRAMPGYGFIGASKAALEALARALAQELGPRGIRVNVVSAGVVDTDALRYFPNREELLANFASRTPAGPVLTPDDVAGRGVPPVPARGFDDQRPHARRRRRVCDLGMKGRSRTPSLPGRRLRLTRGHGIAGKTRPRDRRQPRHRPGDRRAVRGRKARTSRSSTARTRKRRSPSSRRRAPRATRLRPSRSTCAIRQPAPRRSERVFERSGRHRRARQQRRRDPRQSARRILGRRRAGRARHQRHRRVQHDARGGAVHDLAPRAGGSST